MKSTGLLIAFCVLFGFSAMAQSATTADNSTKRITITTKKVDENGKTITETWIADGNDPAKLIQDMAISPEDIKTINIEGDAKAAEGERIFMIRSAGDQVHIEGKLDENVNPSETQQVIVVTKGEDGTEVTKKISTWKSAGTKSTGSAWFYAGKEQSNCAALGVFANAHEGSYGATINRIIDQGPAQLAGLKEGDIIKKVDEFDVNDFSSLFFALSNFRPGEQVVVRYERDGNILTTKATLKEWTQIPGFEYKARTDCGEPDAPAESRRDETDGPTSVPTLQPLELQDAQVYPNPTDGVFSLSFTTEPGQLNVSICDANGKEIYRDADTQFQGRYNRQIDLKGMPQGNYIITVSQGDKVYTRQISKQ